MARSACRLIRDNANVVLDMGTEGPMRFFYTVWLTNCLFVLQILQS